MLGLFLLVAATQSDDLATVVAAAHRDNRAQKINKFAAETVDQSAVGKPFEVVMPLKDGDVARAGASTSGYYSYEPEANELSLVLSSSTVRTTGVGSDGLAKLIYYELFEFGTLRSRESGYVGQNAYGAATRVSVHRGQSNAVAIVDAPGDDNSSRIYEVKIPATGPEARKIALDTVVQISGKLALLDHGKLTRCASSYSGATIDSPTEVSISYCFAGADVRRIAFVRKSTGAVIKEWLIDESDASGPVLWKNIRYGMTKKQLSALYPTVIWPEYGRQIKLIDGKDDAELTIGSKNTVSSVSTSINQVSASEIRRNLEAKYGSPREDHCQYIDTVCSMVWVTRDGVKVDCRSIGSDFKHVDYSIDDMPK